MHTGHWMMHVPDQRPGKVPFVILFHGFCDDRNEINFVHTELSRRLCERGIASVRFDFAGSGDSDGRFEDMTVSSEVEDGLAILDYVKSLDFVDQSRIAIHGLSMGGCVASMVAVWKSGHIGVYIGGGEVIEAMGTHYGVVKTQLTDRNWTAWLEIPYIQYD